MTSTWQQISRTLSDNQIARLVKKLNHAVYFDSGNQTSGQYNILSGDPLSTENGEITVTRQTIPNEFLHLPFICGEIGFTSYDRGKHQRIKSISTKDGINFPDEYYGYYTWSYIYNHQTSEGLFTFSPLCSQEQRKHILSIVEDLTPTIYIEDTYVEEDIYIEEDTHEVHSNISWQPEQSYEIYQGQFNRIKDYIYAGDCYQVNLAQRFKATLEGDIFSFYCETRKKTNTHFACFMSMGDNKTLLSFSPEQFISIRNRKISTRPIKGTIENKADLSPEELLKSDKNKAENLMIVDLLRNDLSKVCKTYSVKAEELFKLETYKNVHHLVSTITGELKDGISEKEAYLECFPGGSITGAPKIRAMEIIDELELYPRSAYCGSVYYLNDNGNFDSNILIRSIVHTGDNLYCWGGGGIVADSNVEEEYQESITKVRNLFDHLEI